MNKKRWISGLLIGSLVGAGVALLSATHSGKETRAMISEKSLALKDKVSSTVDDTRTQIGELTSTVVDKTRDRFSQLKNAASKLSKEEMTA
jgi:gas vesicle protein